jgi:hypothetical protein
MSETPILDLQCDPPRPHYSWTPIICGVVIGLAMLRWAELDVRWAFPILYLSIAFHEVGHLVAGKLVGMKSGGLVVGGLMILKSGSRWICRFDFRRILSGGLAKPLPNKGDIDRAQQAWMVAGGPLSTLLLVAVPGIALKISGSPVAWLTTLFWINVFLLISTFVPAGGLNKSDIPRIWFLLRHPDQARSWAAVLQVQSEETAGVLPRDWDAETFARMLDDNSADDNTFRQMMAFYRRIDQGDDPAALAHLEKALAASGLCGGPVRHWCFLEASCSSAMLRANPDAARTWLDRASRIRKPASRLSLDAAIAQSERRYEDAIPLWDAALAHLVKLKYDSGLTRFVKAKIAEYRQQCVEALKSPARASASGGAA